MPMTLRRMVLVVVGIALAASGVLATPEAASAVTTVQVVVPGTAGEVQYGGTGFVATGVVLGPGKAAVATARGTVYLAVLSDRGGLPNGPDGGNPGLSFPAGSLVPSSPFGCLAARVGTGAWRCIGAGPTVLTGTGEVQFGVNDGFFGAGDVPGYADNSGRFVVTLSEGSTYPPSLSLLNVSTRGSHHHRR